MNLRTCQHCEGFVPSNVVECPHCAHSLAPLPSKKLLSNRTQKWMTFAGASAMAFTLMACYGMPPCEQTEDKDKDGYAVCVGAGYLDQRDCDDNDSATHPGAEDKDKDGKDQNCDGTDGPSQQ